MDDRQIEDMDDFCQVNEPWPFDQLIATSINQTKLPKVKQLALGGDGSSLAAESDGNMVFSTAETSV